MLRLDFPQDAGCAGYAEGLVGDRAGIATLAEAQVVAHLDGARAFLVLQFA